MERNIYFDGQNVTDTLPSNSKYLKVSPAAGLEHVHDKSGNFVRCHSDIFPFLNQQRLQDYLSEEQIRDILNEMPRAKDSLQEIRQYVSDDDLMNYIKSRHYQNPAELKGWSEYLTQEYKRHQESLKKESDEKIRKSAVSNFLNKLIGKNDDK